jgi:hypothetical protein
MDQITVPTMTTMFGDLFEAGGCILAFASPAVWSPKECMRTFFLTAGKDNLRLCSEFVGTDVNVEPEHVVEEAAVSQ